MEYNFNHNITGMFINSSIVRDSKGKVYENRGRRQKTSTTKRQKSNEPRCNKYKHRTDHGVLVVTNDEDYPFRNKVYITHGHDQTNSKIA